MVSQAVFFTFSPDDVNILLELYCIKLHGTVQLLTPALTYRASCTPCLNSKTLFTCEYTDLMTMPMPEDGRVGIRLVAYLFIYHRLVLISLPSYFADSLSFDCLAKR